MSGIETKLQSMQVNETQQNEEHGEKRFARRDFLVAIEHAMQFEWENAKVYEREVKEGQPKFFATFPFPYMNGTLHIGHGFTITKAEFATRFHRLLGENALFPFAFHCTGMPIQAAANRLKNELETYGYPPVFPSEDASKVSAQAPATAENKAKGKKTKLAAKTGGVVHQYEIMKKMIPEEEIPDFKDPIHWLHYFPPIGQAHLRRFGLATDWRRSFITTDVNPYYDAFIRWQLNTLKERSRISKGKRPNVYSILDQQICADHDRSSGEGVNPQEYTLIKLKVQNLAGKLTSLSDYNVYLTPATLRPETMYGQTNCFVLPDGEYGAFLINDKKDVFIMSLRAAKNLAHQEYSRVWGQTECLLTLTGWDLLGLPLSAPNSVYDVIYTLPLLTISMGKGTGVVTSVPSDSPDDYAALRDLKQKPLLREKFHIEEHMVMPFEVVPIIDIPGYGNTAAVKVCEDLKIQSQNDKDKLAKAKELVYLKGFYEGVMLVGNQKGLKVCDAKAKCRQELIDDDLALPYFEPESLVMSRSGDECVVAHLTQWYLLYGSEDWKTNVLNHISCPSSFNTYNPIALGEYKSTLEWLKEWAPCRQFGLGTKLPWDTQFVIESLSDSTIYMAYYTIAHHLQSNVDGSKAGPHNIQSEQLTKEVFDYIFLTKSAPPKSTTIPLDTLNIMRKEFQYWYPLDLRVSGKDLIRNHLTMCLYNHAEIWHDEPSKWPRSFFTNGHVQVDAEKMSKSKGNFLSLQFCCDEFSADATRFACADAGDAMDDANFSRDTANVAILKLTTETDWITKMVAASKGNELRTGAYNFNDLVFLNQMYLYIEKTEQCFRNMQWRDGLANGFYEFQILRDTYREICVRSESPMHKDAVEYFMKSQTVLLSPICPHICEHWWKLVVNKGFVVDAAWPKMPAGHKIDFNLIRAGEFLSKTIKYFRELKLKNTTSNTTKSKKTKSDSSAVAKPQQEPNAGHVYIATCFPAWQQSVLKFMQSLFNAETQKFPDDFMKQLKDMVGSQVELKKMTKNVMQFSAFVKAEAELRGSEAIELSMPFDQKQVLESNKSYILKALELNEISFYVVDENENIENGDVKKMELATPGKPTVYLYHENL